ncbi:ankyrin repeat domain-containing protein 54-like [Macrobrachium nipponense]|uniref:ankyrin repeat domain-containing protein 54-like n=1 Tax=Macrobrachium nipponense TaxID=159736 RepID=UPI0030C81B3C
MDSGIDSTESSSNGSLEESGVVGGGGGGEVMEEAQPEDPPSVEQIAPANSPNLSPQHQLVNIPPVPSELKSLAAAAASTLSSTIKTLSETADNVSPSRSSDRRGSTNNNVTEGPSISLFKMAKTEIPEGSHLQLHFPLSEGSNSEDSGGTSYDIDPPAGLTFANVSPSMYLSRGYEAYSQGYAIQPYENNALQKKIRTLRLRMRQHQYQILSSKAKERTLRIATSLNNVDTVEQLLREGVNPRVTDEKERSPLHVAASKGYTDIVRLLLQYGADPNQRDAIGNTALHLAACTSHIDTVTLLLRAGTNVRQADNQGYSPLHLARSKLRNLQRDSNSSSQEIKRQVYQVIEMMQTYLECSGNPEEAELLTMFTNQLSLSDSRQQVESDLQTLLNSLHDLSLVKSKAA